MNYSLNRIKNLKRKNKMGIGDWGLLIKLN